MHESVGKGRIYLELYASEVRSLGVTYHCIARQKLILGLIASLIVGHLENLSIWIYCQSLLHIGGKGELSIVSQALRESFRKKSGFLNFIRGL